MTEAPVSPLRRRMIEDMTIRKLAPRMQEGYIRAVNSFSAFLGASPDAARFEDLRRYQLHLVSIGAGAPTINHTVTRASGGFHFLAAQRSGKIAKDRDRALDVAMVPRQIVSGADDAETTSHVMALHGEAAVERW
jgi:hypothetical protein